MWKLANCSNLLLCHMAIFLRYRKANNWIISSHQKGFFIHLKLDFMTLIPHHEHENMSLDFIFKQLMQVRTKKSIFHKEFTSCRWKLITPNHWQPAIKWIHNLEFGYVATLYTINVIIEHLKECDCCHQTINFSMVLFSSMFRSESTWILSYFLAPELAT